VRVSDASNDGRAKGSNSDPGVLANLPRTRPQRSSARRAAARKAASAATSAPPKAKLAQTKPAEVKVADAKPAKATPTKARPTKATPTKARPTKATPTKARSMKAKHPADETSREETVPRQGFEVDGDIPSGSVQPPGAAELVSSAAELAGELAKAGVTGGARLLKDLFARLPSG
jgi:hypothetical protein